MKDPGTDGKENMQASLIWGGKEEGEKTKICF